MHGLKEWCQASLRYIWFSLTGNSKELITPITRPRNCEELFNLWHASLCNVIEHIFGMLKCQFRALQYPLEYNMYIQARLPVTLCAVHNLIHWYNADVSFDEEFAEGEPGGDELQWRWTDGWQNRDIQRGSPVIPPKNRRRWTWVGRVDL